MILIALILCYLRDCKDIGKENLAVSLRKCIMAYFAFILLPLLPSILAIIKLLSKIF